MKKKFSLYGLALRSLVLTLLSLKVAVAAVDLLSKVVNYYDRKIPELRAFVST